MAGSIVIDGVRVRKDLTGQKFGRLSVITVGGAADGGRNRCWKCRCDCGAELEVRGSCLTTGHTQSCGCIWRERLIERNTKHGKAYTPEFAIWQGMITRCTNANRRSWKDYGGRGIRVCERWIESFENFLADVGPRPSKDHSLDRYPNTNGNYEPGNVRWATIEQQSRNRTNNRLLTLNGETHCLIEWAEILGYSYAGLKDRIRKGLPLAQVLSAEALTSQWRGRKRRQKEKGKQLCSNTF